MTPLKAAYALRFLWDIGLINRPTEELEKILEAAYAALKTLPKKERNVIRAIYFQGKSLSDVGLEIGRTKERARQQLQKGLRILRHPKHLRKYWGTKGEYLNELLQRKSE